MQRVPAWVWSIALLIVGLGVWEWALRADTLQLVFPSPSSIARALWRGLTAGLTAREGIYLHLGYTVMEAGSGFMLGCSLGIILGTIIAQFPFFGRVLTPYIVALQSLPKVAIAPMFIVWFGFGMTSKVLICSLLTFFPLLVNTMAGLRSVPGERIELLRSLCADRWTIFKKVAFPSALPFIFAGLNMAVVYSILGAIVGEFVGARHGLGVLIQQSQFNMDVASAFSVFVVLSLLGIAATNAVRAVQRRVMFWAETDRVTGA